MYVDSTDKLGKLVRESLKTRKDYVDWFQVRVEYTSFNVTLSATYLSQKDAENAAKNIMENPQDFGRDYEYPESVHVWKGTAVSRYSRRDIKGNLTVLKPE